MKALTAHKIATRARLSYELTRRWLEENVEAIDIIPYGMGTALIYPRGTMKRIPEIKAYIAGIAQKRIIATAADEPQVAQPQPDTKTLVIALQAQINELARRVA